MHAGYTPEVSHPVIPSVPDPLSLRSALDDCEPLRRLRDRLAESEQRMAAVCRVLPPDLTGLVRAGPLDDSGWTLLAANGAVAAKLRQLKPRLEMTLREERWQVSAIRIRVQSTI
jgi:hypothetical protein